MSLVASCQCGKSFQAKPELAGKSVPCPACGSTMKVPPLASTPPAAAAGGLRVSCGCGKTIVAPPTMAGQKGKCPGCGAILSIPTASGAGPGIAGLGGAADPFGNPLGGGAADPFAGGADSFGGQLGGGMGLGGYDAGAFGGAAPGGYSLPGAGQPAAPFGAPAGYGAAAGSFGGPAGGARPASASKGPGRSPGQIILLIVGGLVGSFFLVGAIVWILVWATDDPPQVADVSSATPTMASPTMPGTPPGMSAPGMTPPGTSPPGMAPPGMMAPGVTPTGTIPPGANPSGTQPPTFTAPGAPPGVAPGTTPGVPPAPGGFAPGTTLPPGAGAVPGVSGTPSAAPPAAPPPRGWITYRSAADHYSVALPKQPREDKQSAQGIDLSTVIADSPDGDYLVVTTRMPPQVSAALDSKTAVGAAVDLFLAQIEGKSRSNKEITANGHYGREIEFVSRKDGRQAIGSARFFMIDGWNYQLLFVTPGISKPIKSINAFFESFRVDASASAGTNTSPGTGAPPVQPGQSTLIPQVDSARMAVILGERKEPIFRALEKFDTAFEIAENSLKLVERLQPADGPKLRADLEERRQRGLKNLAKELMISDEELAAVRRVYEQERRR